MSSALALASVTALLRNLLQNGLTDRGAATHVGGDVTVSALPPDRITTGGDERSQLNVFLYQVTPSTGIRHVRPLGSGTSPPGSGGVGPLALDLYYLFTAYGAQDFHAELLLGYTLQLLHETPSLTREEIRSALHSLTSAAEGKVVPPAVAALAESGLADQVDQIQIAPQFLTIEELSKLWSSFQSRYRPSAAYKVSVVPIL